MDGPKSPVNTAPPSAPLLRSRKSLVLRRALIVTEEDLTGIDTYLRHYFPDRTYVARCSDDTQLGPASLADLLSYENPDFRRVIQVTIVAKRNPGRLLVAEDQVTLVLGSLRGTEFLAVLSETGGVDFRFHDVKEQIPIDDEIQKRIRTMQPWYWPIARISLAFALPMLGIMLVIALLTVESLTTAVTGHALLGIFSIKPNDASGSAWLLPAVVGFCLSSWLLDLFRQYAFPTVFFSLGRQSRAYAHRQRVAYWVFGGIILSIAINVFANFLSRFLPR